MTLQHKKILHLLWRAVVRLFGDETLPLAGNIAFRSIFSVFPFLIFLTALAGFIGNEGLAEKVVSFLLDVAPQQLVKPLEPEIRSILTVQRTGLLSIAIVLMVWSAMSGVDSVRMALNRAYDLTEDRHPLFLFAQNLLFIILTATALLILALLIVFIPSALDLIAAYAPRLANSVIVINYLRYPLAALVLFIGLILCHRILLNAHYSLREILPGVTLTVVALILLSMIFSYYLSHFNSFTNTYSSLSGVFAAMFYLYLVALILIFGGELNRVIKLYQEPDKKPGRPKKYKISAKQPKSEPQPSPPTTPDLPA